MVDLIIDLIGNKTLLPSPTEFCYPLPQHSVIPPNRTLLPLQFAPKTTPTEFCYSDSLPYNNILLPPLTESCYPSHNILSVQTLLTITPSKAHLTHGKALLNPPEITRL